MPETTAGESISYWISTWERVTLKDLIKRFSALFRIPAVYKQERTWHSGTIFPRLI